MWFIVGRSVYAKVIGLLNKIHMDGFNGTVDSIEVDGQMMMKDKLEDG